MHSISWFGGLIALLLSGCAAFSTERITPIPEPASISQQVMKTDSQIEEPALDTHITTHPDLRVELNERVKKWIRTFTTSHRDIFGRFLARGSRYKSLVQKTFESQGIPKELYYLGMIESGYRPRAVSSARCVGIWQFGRATAKDYGLRIRYGRDDRTDPVRSTHAAGKYLRNLYRTFGSWHLAIAAYNSGPGRIAGAIRRGETRDFWTLIERGVLPEETMEYVPQFFAAILIGENAEKYGFDSNTSIVEEPPLRKRARDRIYRVRRGDTLTEISQRFGVSIHRLKQMNRLPSSTIRLGQKLRLEA